ncbi:hypothetical protein BDW68DRAFT_194628 [Aspergillus falconensis]
MVGSPQPPKRAPGACHHCRARKVKCSGTQPCTSCQRRDEECIFEGDRRISVSKREFLALKRKLAQLEHSDDGGRAIEDRQMHRRQEHAPRSPQITRGENDNDTPDDVPDAHLDRNPLVSPSSFVHRVGKRRRTWFFQGPTSSWSFTHRVLNSMAERFSPHTPVEIPFHTDGDAYQVYWGSVRPDETPDVSDLPSHDYALYLVSTTRFHLGELFHLFDEEEFLADLDELYDDVQAKVQTSRLWYIQFLIVMAFGEAFLSPTTHKPASKSGSSQYFTRAMALLPDQSKLWDDPILAIEVLAAVALYLYSLDMRDSSCCYIGQAMRIAVIEGLHRTLPAELDPKLASRCTRIWWTTYILENKLTASVGAPSAVREEDVTAMLWDPQTCPRRLAGLSLHVKVSQAMTHVLHTVYHPGGEKPALYLQKVQSNLRHMADLSREWEKVFQSRFKTSVDAVSGLSTRLTLSYHLCVIIAIRPLLFSLLLERLDSHGTDKNRRPLSDAVMTLARSCVESATASLKILGLLCEKNLLETFLPFDLEYTFTSAFTLRLVSMIVPNEGRSLSCLETATKVLEDMMLRGNRIAEFRRAELGILEWLIHKSDGPRIQADTQEIPCDNALTQNIEPGATSMHGVDPAADINSALGLDWEDQTEEVGLLSEQILTMVNQLGTEEVLLKGNLANLGEDRWLWDGT